MRRALWAFLCVAGCASEGAMSDAGSRSDAAMDASSIDAAIAADAPIAPLDAARDDDVPGEERRDVIVAVGANHARYLSVDTGYTWCFVARATEPDATGFDNPYLLRGVSFHEGRFVSGSWRALWVSENGFEWTDVTGEMQPATRQWIAAVAYGNGWWVATGGYGTAMRSRDLSTWEVVSDELPGDEASRSLAFGAGMFVTARDSVGWWSSTDGTAWAELDSSAGTEVRFDGTRFVEAPDYDEGHGVRLRVGWPDRIERAEGDATFERVATVDDALTHFAFGSAPVADFTRARLGDGLADCLDVR